MWNLQIRHDVRGQTLFTDAYIIEILFQQDRLHSTKSLKQNIGKNMFYQVK